MTGTDALVEAVARAIRDEMAEPAFCGTWEEEHPEDRETFMLCAQAAITAARPFIEAEVLERAAKLIEADDFKIGDFGLNLRDFDGVGSWLKAVRATAIRQLKEQQS